MGMRTGVEGGLVSYDPWANMQLPAFVKSFIGITIQLLTEVFLCYKGQAEFGTETVQPTKWKSLPSGPLKEFADIARRVGTLNSQNCGFCKEAKLPGRQSLR